MPPVDQSFLPSRYREANVRRYARDIARIVARWPAVTPIDPLVYMSSAITVVARLRDAIVAYQRYNYESPYFDRTAFLAVADQIQVSHRGDTIRAGSREALALDLDLDALPAPASVGDVKKLGDDIHLNSTADREAVAVLGRLAAIGALACPIEVGMIPEHAAWLEEHFDVSVTEIAPETYVIK